ncbi:sugar ABC transporter permease [Thermoanaerobacterium sp. CMT5567-10]|uniref:carbohydrate ABC transporter permease n=1 Tax=Thermoanaerobacterium sp. CMT5567-10 TaxID=3061989 RepID=UPI0026E0BF66|nr:sugar ABC transporter permease [Thermoanaerobacterium sp. CMT5567-10]WKV10161.1 sugar ABC transporter permease [Thermoanaerobacterium sp. CMT5567-10]
MNKKGDIVAGYLFLLPNIIGFLIFVLGPALASLILSFYDWNLFNTPNFVGVGNYVKILHDNTFWQSLFNTIYFTIGSVPFSIVLSLILAVALNQKIKGLTLFRTIYFLPVVSSMVAIALVWRWMYNNDYGILNSLLSQLHLPTVNWLSSTTWAMPAIILMSIWKSLGYDMVIFLAGLQGIPNSYYEAAKIDGASGFQLFRYITIPLLSPTTFFVTIISLISSFQVFDQAYVMTDGGPANKTMTIVYYLYRSGFSYYKMGYASAVAWALFIIILILTIIQWKYSGRKINYQ